MFVMRFRYCSMSINIMTIGAALNFFVMGDKGVPFIWDFFSKQLFLCCFPTLLGGEGGPTGWDKRCKYVNMINVINI